MALAVALGCAAASPALADALPAPGAGTGVPMDLPDDDDPAAWKRVLPSLRAQAAVDPANMGALLDLAIAHCLAGQVDEGQRLFLLLEALPDLPMSIAEVVAWYRGGGCRPRAPRHQAFVAAGAGWARNFNLAPLSDTIYLPALDAQLALAEGSRRRDAAFASAEAGGLWPVTADGRWLLGGYVQALRYQGSADYAFTGGQASLGWRHQDASRVTEAQSAIGALGVGDSTRVYTGTLSASNLWSVGPGWWVGGAVSATRLDYREQQALDARQFEARARVRWQTTGARLTAEAGWLEDLQVRERPGGDRRGPVAQGQWQWSLSKGRSLEGTVRHGWLRDSAPYSEALFGTQQRAPRVTMMSLAWRQPLPLQANVRLEYRMTRSRDAMELFKYSTQSAWASIEWLLGRREP